MNAEIEAIRKKREEILREFTRRIDQTSVHHFSAPDKGLQFKDSEDIEYRLERYTLHKLGSRYFVVRAGEIFNRPLPPKYKILGGPSLPEPREIFSVSEGDFTQFCKDIEQMIQILEKKRREQEVTRKQYETIEEQQKEDILKKMKSNEREY